MSTRLSTRRLSALKYAIVAATLSFFASLAGAVVATAQDANPPEDELTLQQVEARFVCMITNKHFEDEQIAVPVGGQTYYGCCKMCVEKLNGAPESRYATDPVSGARVDKATAVLGAGADNRVRYFESVETLRAFRLSDAEAKQ